MSVAADGSSENSRGGEPIPPAASDGFPRGATEAPPAGAAGGPTEADAPPVGSALEPPGAPSAEAHVHASGIDPRQRIAPPPAPPPASASPGQGESGGGAGPATQGFGGGQKRAIVEVGVVLVAVVLVVVLLVAFAGRLAAWALPLVPLEVDRRLGQLTSSQLQLAQTECPGEASAYVTQLGQRLLAVADEPPFEFEFRLVDDPAVNAFALPGGYVTVNRGLLDDAQSGEEVAAVLAHEIQHALLRHGTQRMLRSVGGSVALALIFGGTDLNALAGASAQLTSLAYGRADEAEADRLGVELLGRAGISPLGLGTFFERLAKEGGARPPELLSTHPDPGGRAELARSAAAGVSASRLPPPPRVVCPGGSAEPQEADW